MSGKKPSYLGQLTISHTDEMPQSRYLPVLWHHSYQDTVHVYPINTCLSSKAKPNLRILFADIPPASSSASYCFSSICASAAKQFLSHRPRCHKHVPPPGQRFPHLSSSHTHDISLTSEYHYNYLRLSRYY